MKFNELKDALREYNKTHSVRFKISEDGKSLKIGEYQFPFNFTESDYKKAEKFINKYGMLKEDKDCYGDHLWYKGLKWNELTEEQRQSVIGTYAGKPNVVDPSLFESSFNENRSFLYFY